MELDEETARNILDFLAQRAGYLLFTLSIHGIVCVENVFGGKFEDYETFAGEDASYDVFYLDYHGPEIHLAILNAMLEHSRQGEKIGICYFDEVILPAYTTLEQILVEMDLADRDI